MTQPSGPGEAGADTPSIAPAKADPALPRPSDPAAVLAALAAAGIPIGGGLDQAQHRSRSTGRVWGLVILALGLVALLVRGYLQQRQHGEGLTIWQVIWLTLPIVAAGGFVAYRLASGRGLAISHLIGLVVGTAGTSYLTGISSGQHVSNSLFQFNTACLLQNACTSPLATANPLSYVGKVVNNYWHVYGTAGFVSAAVVGAVIGLGLGLLGRRRTMGGAGRLMG